MNLPEQGLTGPGPDSRLVIQFIQLMLRLASHRVRGVRMMRQWLRAACVTSSPHEYVYAIRITEPWPGCPL